ncbi:hypothetical protein, partial [Paracoccus simplex]
MMHPETLRQYQLMRTDIPAGYRPACSAIVGPHHFHARISLHEVAIALTNHEASRPLVPGDDNGFSYPVTSRPPADRMVLTV